MDFSVKGSSGKVSSFPAFSASSSQSSSSSSSSLAEPGHAVGRREAVPGARRVDHGGHARRGLPEDARGGGRGGGSAFASAAAAASVAPLPTPPSSASSSSSASAPLDQHAPLAPSLHEHGAEGGWRPGQEQPRRGLDLGVALRPRASSTVSVSVAAVRGTFSREEPREFGLVGAQRVDAPEELLGDWRVDAAGVCFCPWKRTGFLFFR